MCLDVISPVTISELLKTTKQLNGNKFRFGAGCTDLLLELRKNPEDDLTIINLSQVKDPHLPE